MKILIFGLPGSGKTHLAHRLKEELDCAWFNADKVREMSSDWDFSDQARLRQAQRMSNLADFEIRHGRSVICDFVCPTAKLRKEFGGDIKIYLDTIEKCRFEDTQKLFEQPNFEIEKVDFRILNFLSDDEIVKLADLVKIKCNRGSEYV